MTRINVVPPRLLTSKHLLAEYRELPRIFTRVQALIEQGILPDKIEIPDTYVLGTGHQKFFYNKLNFLLQRYYRLCMELRLRNFRLDSGIEASVLRSANFIVDKHPEWGNDYVPTIEDMYLNMARLVKRCDIQSVKEELESHA